MQLAIIHCDDLTSRHEKVISNFHLTLKRVTLMSSTPTSQGLIKPLDGKLVRKVKMVFERK